MHLFSLFWILQPACFKVTFFLADINDDGGNRSIEEEGYYYKVVPKSNDRGPPDAGSSRVNGRVKQPSLTSVVDTLTRLSPKAPAVGESANEDGVASLPLDPEKLAYILIGVCCGLSLLCLVSTGNDRYSGHRYSGIDRYSGTKNPDNAILFTVSGITAIVEQQFRKFRVFSENFDADLGILKLIKL